MSADPLAPDAPGTGPVPNPDERARDGRLDLVWSWALLGVLFALIAITLPELGSDPWPFKPPSVHPTGPLGHLVNAADDEWDVGIARAAAFLAALLCGALAVPLLLKRRWPRHTGTLLVLVIGLMLMLPSTALQLGLRQATERWFFTNDSTYQIELAGDKLRQGIDPYGHDWRASGLERFYTRDGTLSLKVLDDEVALDHYAYFPGTLYTSFVWRVLPAPYDDYRLLILLFTLAGLGAVLAFKAPLGWRLAIGALLVCNPIAIRSAWFGQNDAPSLVLMVLAFALVTRRRFGWAAASLAAAILLKQFALVALPFLALMMVHAATTRAHLKQAAAVFAGVVLVGILPFLIWDPVAFYEDTVKYGAGTYKIVGYGLSAILVKLHVLADREGEYPFALIALVSWVPLTLWLLYVQRRAQALWVGAVGFALSILWLMFIGRTFNNYYLIWPLTGAAIAALLAVSRRTGETAR